MDFRNVTRKFFEPDFDGDPIIVIDPDSVKPKKKKKKSKSSTKRKKIRVKDLEVEILKEEVRFISKDGRLITETIRDFTKKTVKEEFKSLDNFIKVFNNTEKKSTIIKLVGPELIFELEKIFGDVYDIFDLICHVAFDQPPKTRRERAIGLKSKNYFSEYSKQCQNIIDILLDKYSDQGIENLEDINVLKVKPLNTLGTPIEIINAFGGKKEFEIILSKIKTELYN